MPDDVAVIGFDDLPPLEETTETLLMTVHQDIEGMGCLMARLLFQRIQGTDDASSRPADHRLPPVITPTHLVLRETA
ncbi:substrate-binding domain-containing protein [Streptomyces sp. NPDC054766]